MKILVLAKRRPQGRDLLRHPFGRFYHLPAYLASKGHEVTVCLLDYKNTGKAVVQRNNIEWISLNFMPGTFIGFYLALKKQVKHSRPDWIIGCSDSWYGVMAQRLATKYACRSLIDAYDDFESYIRWLKPLHYLWRKSLRKADVVTAAGPQLLEKMSLQRDIVQRKYILPMSADEQFYPRDRQDSRQAIELPLTRKLIGYCGSISTTRNMHEIFHAVEKVRQVHHDVTLVLSGRCEKGIKLPDFVIYKGYLEDSQVPLFINAMDVMVSWLKPGLFAESSYPVKIYEALACQRPIVARDTIPCRWILQDDRNFLAANENELAEKLSRHLERDIAMTMLPHSWNETAAKIDDIICDRI